MSWSSQHELPDAIQHILTHVSTYLHSLIMLLAPGYEYVANKSNAACGHVKRRYWLFKRRVVSYEVPTWVMVLTIWITFPLKVTKTVWTHRKAFVWLAYGVCFLLPRASIRALLKKGRITHGKYTHQEMALQQHLRAFWSMLELHDMRFLCSSMGSLFRNIFQVYDTISFQQC